MQGTAATEQAEFLETYELKVVQVPPHQPSQRYDEGWKLFIKREDKFDWIVNVVLRASYDASGLGGRPVLIGTNSVAESDDISACLWAEG